jgi:hypothetical protein
MLAVWPDPSGLTGAQHCSPVEDVARTDQFGLGECSDIISDAPDENASERSFTQSLHSESDGPDPEFIAEDNPPPNSEPEPIPDIPIPHAVPPDVTPIQEPVPPSEPILQAMSEVLITTVDSPVVVDETIQESSEQPVFTEGELQRCVILVESGELPPDEMIPALRAYLCDRVLAAIMAQDYDEAARWKDLVNRIASDEVGEKRHQEEQRLKLCTVEERIRVTRQALAEIRAKWCEKMSAFELEKRGKLDEMQMRHEQEILKFREHWAEPSTLLAFTKPSTQLMVLRRQQRLSALADEFSRAKELKKRGDELERIETAEAERKASASMKAVHRNLLRRHVQEAEHAQMNWERQYKNLAIERDSEVEKVELSLRQLELRHTEIRTGRGRSASALIRTPTPASSATSRVRKVSEFKSGANQPKLPLNALGRQRMRVRRGHEGKRKRLCTRQADF